MPEAALAISVALVVLVVLLFLRNGRAALIPSVAIPVSLTATFGVMYLCGYSLNNVSLMALTIATGFVVDDAIVVLENVVTPRRERHGARHGGAGRRRGSRLHGAGDDPVARRRLHPHAAHGWLRGPLFPRIRGNAVGGDPGLAGGVAHHHPHDVRPAAPVGEGTPPGPAPRVERARFRGAPPELRAHAGVGAGSQPGHGARSGRNRGPQRLSLRDRSQGLLPATGHGPAHGAHPGRSERFLPADAGQARPFRRHRARRPGASRAWSASPAAPSGTPGRSSSR